MKAMIFSCLLFDGGRARGCLDSLDCLIADAPRRVPTFLSSYFLTLNRYLADAPRRVPTFLSS